jgi:uncharacterized protein (DUF1810 family)
MNNPFNLQRFVEAQDAVYDQVCSELRAARKTSHWMWFIFPQIAGLGFSSMAQRYAISGRAEAAAYLDHPVLGTRLVECTDLVNAVDGRTAHQIFGSPDDVKFRSSMTLFALCAEEPQAFLAALAKYFEGKADPLTEARLGGDTNTPVGG